MGLLQFNFKSYWRQFALNLIPFHVFAVKTVLEGERKFDIAIMLDVSFPIFHVLILLWTSEIVCHINLKLRNFCPLGKLSYKKNGKKRGHWPHVGGGGQPQFPFLSPNLPDPQITQKWTLDTTIWMLCLKVGLVRTPYTTQYLPVPRITFVWRRQVTSPLT